MVFDVSVEEMGVLVVIFDLFKMGAKFLVFVFVMNDRLQLGS